VKGDFKSISRGFLILVRIEDENEATARIESALYSAGRPLSIEDLIRASGTESRVKTMNLLEKLMQKTRSSFKAIEIVTLPDLSFVFQLKPEYSSSIGRRYASKPILPKATQKTLSYIAYEQPISGKQLVEVRGSGVYSHLKELKQLDFIENQNVGRMKIYNTTEKFNKYFGVQGDADTLRQKLFKKVRTRNTSKILTPKSNT
jgi:segregation and condensation protein B|tara:strand:- start:2903 stop:3511 length:609 start_codon:yes stop_codon:yes gene_type:complete